MLRLMIRQTLSSASLGAARVTPRFPECAAATRTASWEFSSSELLNTFTRGFSASGDSDSSTPSLDEIATDAEAAKTPREVKAEKMGLKYTRGVAEDPWTPTDQLFKRKSYFKRMSHLVQVRSSSLVLLLNTTCYYGNAGTCRLPTCRLHCIQLCVPCVCVCVCARARDCACVTVCV